MCYRGRHLSNNTGSLLIAAPSIKQLWQFIWLFLPASPPLPACSWRSASCWKNWSCTRQPERIQRKSRPGLLPEWLANIGPKPESVPPCPKAFPSERDCVLYKKTALHQYNLWNAIFGLPILRLFLGDSTSIVVNKEKMSWSLSLLAVSALNIILTRISLVSPFFQPLGNSQT